MAVNITVSMPEKLLYEIDNRRKDVSRSRYIMRLVESGIHQEEKSE